MNVPLKRLSVVVLLALVCGAVGCRHPLPPPAPVPAPPPPPPPPAPTVTLSANTTTVTAGTGITLTYSATNATSVTIDQGIGAVNPAAGGTRQVTPTGNTTYTATANGPGGTAQSARVSITVNTPAPPPQRAAAPPTPPPAPPVNRGGPVRTAADIFRDTMVPILFDYDKSSIRASEEPKLLAISSYLKQNANIRFTIEGHADERGGQEYNIALGDARAAAVRKYLAGQGVPETRNTAVSYGEEKPICREETEDCWQRNRRAAFVMN